MTDPSPNPVTTPPAHHNHAAGLLEAFTGLLPIITVAIFIITFIVQPFRIPSESMERTLLVGDFLLVNKQVYAPAGNWHWLMPYRSPRHNDIIVFHSPIDPNEHLIKRTIGLPGDRIRLRSGQVFLNDLPLIEPFAVYRSSAPDNFRDNFPSLHDADPTIDAQWWMQMRSLIDSTGSLTIPAGSYFMMGDNRNNSQDSRYWGFMHTVNAEGPPILIYLSLRTNHDEDTPQSPLDRVFRWNRILRIVR